MDRMIESTNEQFSDDTITYFCQLNCSIFTEKLQALQEMDHQLNHHQLQRKRWLKIIRNSLRAQYIHIIMRFLFAAKTHTLTSRHILTRALKHWEDRNQKRQILKSFWLNFSNLAIKRSHEKTLSEYREKVHRHRSLLTSKYITSLPQYNTPCYNFLISTKVPNDQFSNADSHRFEKENSKHQNLENDQLLGSQKVGSSESSRDEQETIQSEEKEISHSNYHETIQFDEHQIVERDVPIEPGQECKNKEPLEEQKSSLLFIQNNIHNFTNSVLQHGKKLIHRYDLPTLGVAFIIMILTIIITYATRSFIFWANGTFDRYREYEYNQTLPPYDRNYDVNTFVNYSELLESDEVDVIDILKHMSRELREVKIKQAELIDQIQQMKDQK